MLPKINPKTTKSWKELESLVLEDTDDIRSLFKTDKNRFEKYSFELDDVFFDFSKNNINDVVFSKLCELSKECKLNEAIKAFFEGEKINETEGRSVQHHKLRKLSDSTNTSSEVVTELEKIKKFSTDLINGEWKGYTGEKITDVVNIGIGGSDLGPKLVTHALKSYWKHIRPHFISNIDAEHLTDTLSDLNPETTLFIVSSKSFTTQETITNATSAKQWFFDHGGTIDDIKKHFVAVSTNRPKVEAFGIDHSNMFVFWDWVGGRFSLWSSIGLIISCTIGHSYFEALLHGAERMDNHFRTMAFESNIPVISALIGVWYNTFYKYQSHAILPYDHRLRFLPSYLQQTDMESNGKSIDRNGDKVDYETSPVIWGETGTNGQHAFYQLIHQGTKIVPCDFIAVVNASHHWDHHEKLLANFFAQPEALLAGKTAMEVKNEWVGTNENDIDKLLPYKVFEGNRPTTSIMMKDLTPYNLGILIAHYEHKIFTQGVIWNIFSFDQWGVELGKQLTKPILNELKTGKSGTHDNSTGKLINVFRQMRR